jgi:hypothetical protein
MLKRIVKLGFFLQLIIFTAVTLLLWLPSILEPKPALRLVSEGPLYAMFAELAVGLPLLSTLTALFFTLGISILVYIIGASNDIHNRDNFFSATFMMFFLSWNHSFLVLQPVIPAALLVLFAVMTIMKMYGWQDPLRQVFSASLSIGLASLFYFPAVYFLLLLWFSFITYRVTGWREWMISFIGFILPFIYLFSWYFWIDQFNEGVLRLVKSIDDPGLNLKGIVTVDFVWLITLILIILVASFSMVNLVQDKLISIRKKSFVIVNILFASFPVILLSGSPLVFSHQLLYLPLSLMLTMVLSNSKKTLYLEAGTLIFIGILLVFRYMQ